LLRLRALWLKRLRRKKKRQKNTILNIIFLRKKTWLPCPHSVTQASSTEKKRQKNTILNIIFLRKKTWLPCSAWALCDSSAFDGKKKGKKILY
jgi:hypothetical protein